MSEQLNLKQSVPSDVGELWAQLHAEASANCEALKPQTSRRAVVIIIVISLLFMAAALFSANEFLFKPQEAARVATATARALALDASGRKTATAMAGTATFEAEQGQAAFLATSTAQAATATAEAQRSAASLAGTATAQAVANRAMATAQAEANLATAEANRCQNIILYTLEVTKTPQLNPTPGYVYVTDKAWPAVRADWIVTNTGTCVWHDVKLKDLTGQVSEVELSREGKARDSVAPGETVSVTLYFPRLAAPSRGEWILVVNDLMGNDLTLFDAPHLQLDLGDQVWIQDVDPTPTPTPTSTPTPLPNPTPEPTVCRTVCDKCEKCENDEFGNRVCKQVDCNCREECD